MNESTRIIENGPSWVGLGHREQLSSWIRTMPPEVECLEITAEHFFDGGREYLAWLSARYPLFVHGLGLSLGTPGPLDAETLSSFAEVVEIAEPEWISEHIAFTRTEEVDLGHLNPVVPCAESLSMIAAHARQLAEYCGRPVILENITSYLRLTGDMEEAAFLNGICEEGDCGLLLDITNLFINSRNHEFDPVAWLEKIDPRFIVQCHVVGYGYRDGAWHDSHAAAIQEDLWELIEAVTSYAPLRSIIIERDGDFPPNEDVAAELRRLRRILKSNGPDTKLVTAAGEAPPAKDAG